MPAPEPDSDPPGPQAHNHSLLNPRPVVLDPAVDRCLVTLGSPALGVAGPSSPAGGAAAPTPRPDGGAPRSPARSPWRCGPGSTAPRRTRARSPRPAGPARRWRAGRPTAVALGRSARGSATLLPAGMPDADRLGRDAELAGDLSLTDIGGEQLGRPQSAGLEPVAFSLCRRAARHSWHVPDPRLAGSRAPTRPSPHPSTRHPSSFTVDTSSNLCSRQGG